MALRQPVLFRPSGRPARFAGWLAAVVLVAAGAVHSPAADADSGRRYEQRGDDRGDQVERGGRERPVERRDIGPARAAAIARDRFGGKVLKVEHHGAVYRVKLLLPDGKVKSVYIEAAQ